jgi:UDP-N-acetylglucosamine acyltransferase
MADIHSSAVVSQEAKLESGVKIGPFCVVEGPVELGKDVVLHSHVVVAGRTRVGAGTEIFPFASIGHRPQDLKFHGEDSLLEIGSANVIREYVTMNPGTESGGLVTRVGDNGLYMIGAHVAHDCFVGDRVIMANNATLAGHCTVGDGAILGGLSAVHQFVRVGAAAMIGGMSAVEQDVVPFGLVMGDRARLAGLNLVGLKRAGHDRAAIRDLRHAYDVLFAGEGTFQERLERAVREVKDEGPVGELLAFVRADSSRSILQPKFLHAR